MRRRWRRRRGFRKRGFRGNLCSWIGYTLARRWRAWSSLRFSPLRLVAPIVVGPELILSFNGTYRAPRSLLPATSYPRFSGRERYQTGVPIAATRLDSIIGTELRDTLRPIARLLGSHLRQSPPSNPKVVWVSAELIAHEYHNQGSTLYRTRRCPPSSPPTNVYRSKLS